MEALKVKMAQGGDSKKLRPSSDASEYLKILLLVIRLRLFYLERVFYD